MAAMGPHYLPILRNSALFLAFASGWFLAETAEGQQPANIDFAHDVVPILRNHCVRCHTGDQKKGGFSFNTRGALLAGGETGAAAVPGKSDQSELIKRVIATDDAVKMPPEGPRVPTSEIALLRRWIDAGAPWEDGFAFRASGYEPPLMPRRPELPPVQEGRENPVDRIVDAYWAS